MVILINYMVSDKLYDITVQIGATESSLVDYKKDFRRITVVHGF